MKKKIFLLLNIYICSSLEFSPQQKLKTISYTNRDLVSNPRSNTRHTTQGQKRSAKVGAYNENIEKLKDLNR